MSFAAHVLELMFPYMEGASRINTEKYGEDAVTVTYEIPFQGLDLPLHQRQMRLLGSHLNGQDGIMGWATTLRGETHVIHIHYIPTVITEEQVWKALTSPKWNVRFTDGRVEEQDAQMTFAERGRTIN